MPYVGDEKHEALGTAVELARDVAADLDAVLLTHFADADTLDTLRPGGADLGTVRAVTGAGATAGLDFGLTLAALLRGQEAAERVQLFLEYEPVPPFHKGTPALVGPERMAQVRAGRVWMDAQAREASLAAARRLGL